MEKLFSRRLYDRLSGVSSVSWFLAFGAITVLASILTNFFALPNNLIYSDEGWYLYLLKELPADPSINTRFFLLFKNVFHNNVYLIRLACWTLSLLSCGFLAYGLLSLTVHSTVCKERLLWWFLIFSTIYYGQLFIVACPSFNYITMNKIVAELGLGSLFLGISRQKVSPWFLVSGFVISFLLPIMATNVSLIPLMVVAMILLLKRGIRIKNCLVFVAGMVLFAFYYCSMVESPEVVMDFIQTSASDTVAKGSAQYGVLFYWRWTVGALAYFLKCVAVGAVLYFGGRLIKRITVSWSKILTWALVGVFSGGLLLVSYLFIPPTFPFPGRQFGSFYWPNDLWWILLCMLLIAIVYEKRGLRKEEIVVTALLAMTVVCLSLGSNMAFNVRQNEYVFFIVPAIVYLILRYKDGIFWKVAFFSVALLKLGLFAVEVRGHNWNGDPFFGKHIPAQTIDIPQHVNLTQRDVTLLTDFKRMVPQGETVLIDSQNWSEMVLLDYKPASHDFEIFRRTAPEVGQVIDKVIKEQGHVWVVGSKYNENVSKKMQFIEGYNMVIDTVGNNLFYYVTCPVTSLDKGE